MAEAPPKLSPTNIIISEVSVSAYLKLSKIVFKNPKDLILYGLVQFSSVAQSCPTLCNPMDCSTPGFPVLHYLPELAQTHVHWVCDAIQTSHPLSPPSPSALNLSQHQGLFQRGDSSHQVAKVLEFQHQSFPMIIQGWFPLGLIGLMSFRIDSFDLLAVQGTLKCLL